jgi:hypothetical protein
MLTCVRLLDVYTIRRLEASGNEGLMRADVCIVMLQHHQGHQTLLWPQLDGMLSMPGPQVVIHV